ncbi:hypothetical protein ACOMHN_049873 [Nucella lapillus]
MASNSNETSDNKQLDSNPDAERDDVHQPAECRIGNFKPAVLKMCANMPVFTGVYSVSALMTSTLNTYVNSQVTTLERHFGFSSAQTGLIMSANDIGFLVIVLFISFIAPRVHIPRALACFTILFGVSGLVCTLPQFLFGVSTPASSLSGADVSNVSATMTSDRPSGNFGGQLCDGVSQGDVNCSATVEEPSVTSEDLDPGSRARAHSGTALLILVVGMVLQGVAKAPRGSFSLYYVDCNVEKAKSGFYMGIVIAVGIMGPAVAFALGGVFNRIYVTLEVTDLHFRHPRWIGAWWLGYLTFGCVACVVALPLFCFPRHIQRHTHNTQDSKAKTEAGGLPSRIGRFMKEFLQALIRLLTNPVYLCCVVSACCVIFAVAGSQSFSSKYIENQFAFPAWKANISMAAVTLTTAVLGTFLGGVVSRRFQTGPMGCLKFVTMMDACCATCTGLMLLFHCPQPLLHNSPGPRAAATSGGMGEEGCGGSCVCDDGSYFPVCAQDGRSFFSPCHAGCGEFVDGNYVNCTCIEAGGTAVAGMCDFSCSMFYPFIVCFCLKAFFSTLPIVCLLQAYIRAVEERDKALSLGVSSFLTSVMGWMLGPICFGKLIDGTCIQWEDSCTGGGACLLYDNDDFRWKLIGYQTIFRVGALFFIVLAYIFARVTGIYERKRQELTGNDVMMDTIMGSRAQSGKNVKESGEAC